MITMSKIKLLRNVLTYILVVLITFSSVTIEAFYDNTDESITGKKEVLKFLNIIGEDDKTFNKSMLAYIAVKLNTGGIEIEQYEENDEFADVNSYTKYASYIQFAVNSNLITPESDTNFGVEEAVTLDDLSMTFLKILGYPNVNSENCDALAHRIGLYKKTVIRNRRNITYNEAINVVYNILGMRCVDNNLLEINNKYDSRTLLERNFDIYTVSGVFETATVKSLDDNSVFIDNVRYEVDNNFICPNDKVGYKVEAYVSMKTSKIIFIDAEKYDNFLLIVYAADVEKVSDGRLLYVGRNSKNKSVNIKDLKVLYNGYETKNYDELFEIKNGTITFISHGANYEYAIVNNYYDMVIGRVFDDVIYDLNDPTLSVDIDSFENCEITANGQKVSADAIEKYNVASIFYSSNRKSCKIALSNTNVQGVYNQKSDNRIKIADSQYGISAYFKKYNNALLGVNGTFYLNYNNEVVYCAYENQWNYGYFLNIGTNGVIEHTPNILLFDDKGEKIGLEFDNKFSLNGIKTRDLELTGNDILTKALKTQLKYNENGEIYAEIQNDYVHQIVKYKLNAEGKISDFLTAQASNNGDSRNELVPYYVGKSYQYQSTSFFRKGLTFKYGLSSVFYIPISADNDFDQSGNVDTVKRSSLPDKSFNIIEAEGTFEEIEYDVYAYDVTDAGFAQCVLIDNKDIGTATTTFPGDIANLFLIEEVSQTMNTEDEIVYSVYGMLNGEKVSYNFDSEYEFPIDADGNEIIPREGDLMRIILSVNNEITNMDLRYIYSENKLLHSTQTGAYYEAVGYVSAVDDYSIKLSDKAEYESNEKIYPLTMLRNICIYDTKTQKTSVGTLNDIRSIANSSGEPSFIYLRTEWDRPLQMIIYK